MTYPNSFPHLLCTNHSHVQQILYAYEDEGGEDVVASLDFWSKPQI